MKCTNKLKRGTGIVLAFALVLSGCGKQAYSFPYDVDSNLTGFQMVQSGEDTLVASFAQDLCVVDAGGNVSAQSVPSISSKELISAGLFDVNNHETLYAKNVHEKLYPASLTKVMTALVALKYGSLDQTLTATKNIVIHESGAQLAGIKEGDKMTLAQALHISLINSANDASVMIAEGVAGSVDAFVELMNEEALRLGATNTHFVNPHGLSADNHYTTSYDLYLIFNEAIQYEIFNEIIQMETYNTTYYDKNGEAKEFSCMNSNWYLRGNTEAPENITVIGGKTGTTNAAGHCLLLLSKDVSDNRYISVILRSEAREVLYSQMSEMLSLITK